jgi:hypothetical protein
MHYGNACCFQDGLISVAQFDLDHQQSISSPQKMCNSLLSLCPYIKQWAQMRGVEEGKVGRCEQESQLAIVELA